MKRQHHTIVVVSWKRKSLQEMWRQANVMFGGHLVSRILHSGNNFISSFYIAPDGHFNDTNESAIYDDLRKQFREFVAENYKFDSNLVEVEFGDYSSL